MPFPVLSLQAAAEVAIDGGSSDALTPSQATAIDSIQMMLIDLQLEALAGSLMGRDTGQPFAELSATSSTQPLSSLDLHLTGPATDVVVPHPSSIPALASR
jgi:hypothetical protein